MSDPRRPIDPDPARPNAVDDGLGPVPPDNQPGAHPGDATDRPDLADFRARFGGGDTTADDRGEAAGSPAESPGEPAPDTGAPGGVAPLLAGSPPSGSVFTWPLRTTAGMMRLGADLVSGLAKRIDDRLR